MTWRELKNIINKKARENKSFLDETVKLFDYEDGEEYDCNITELLHEATENMNTGWVFYLSINEKDLEDEGETEETGVN
jgi:hypothetical protein